MLAEYIYQLKRPYHFIKTGLLKGLTSELAYGFPAKKLNSIAITGSDGKTTSSTLLYHVLKTAGYKVGLLSTVAANMGETEIDTGFHVTSPNPRQLQEFMAELVAQGYTHLVLEATSHGIYQYRTWGIHPLIAGVTNVSHEHLDYHVTYSNYIEAKAEILTKAKLAIINDDDQSNVQLKKILRAHRTPFTTYSQEDSLTKSLKQTITHRFPEQYNQMNARLVWAVTQKLGISTDIFQTAIKTFPGVPGRMEVIQKKPFTVVVDFAHTPKALESVLTYLRAAYVAKSGRLIAVYGCAGLRDRAKRPIMGEIGVNRSDLVVFTAEDPRTEDVWSIIRQMKEQLTTGHNKVISIGDRKEAISFTLSKLAQPGDCIAILGKGHEQSLCYGTIEYPWDDRIVAREFLP